MAPSKKNRRRRAPQQERAAATVDALLEATAELLVEHGYERMTTNHIARRAGVSIGSLYQYFAGKEALLVVLAERYFAAIEAVVADALDRIDHGHAAGEELHGDQIAGLIRALMTVERADPELRQALVTELPRIGDLALVDTLSARIEDRIVSVLARASEQRLRPTSPRLAAQLVVRAVSGIMQSTLRRDPTQVEDPAFEAELVALVRCYLLP